MSTYIHLDMVNGDDSYDGTRARHGSGTVGPVKTPNAAGALVPSGGDIVIMTAGGQSGAYAMDNPANAGTSGARNLLTCDVAATYRDPAGDGFLDATTGISWLTGRANMWLTVYSTVSFDTTDYWDIEKLGFSNKTGSFGSGERGVILANNNSIRDCIIDSHTLGLFMILGSGSAVQSAHRMAIKSATPIYFVAGGSTSFPASPSFNFSNLALINNGLWSGTSADGCCIKMQGTGATEYTYAKIQDVFMSSAMYFSGPVGGFGIVGASTTYNKVDLVRCVSDHQTLADSSLNAASTRTNCYGYAKATTGWTTLTVPPIILWPMLFENSPIKGILSDFSGGLSGEFSYDIHGYDRTVATATTPGPVEALTGKRVLGWPGWASTGKGAGYVGDLVPPAATGAAGYPRGRG